MFRTSQSPETMCSKGLLVKPVSKRPSLGSGSSSKFGSTCSANWLGGGLVILKQAI